MAQTSALHAVASRSECIYESVSMFRHGMVEEFGEQLSLKRSLICPPSHCSERNCAVGQHLSANATATARNAFETINQR